jgi:anti-sigma28 factor (negative regulator of flagellin synthesis)
MKISRIECGKAAAECGAQTKISVEEKFAIKEKNLSSTKTNATPLERGMAVARESLENIDDIRTDLVDEIKRKIELGEYSVSGNDIAEMMLRRLAADKTR